MRKLGVSIAIGKEIHSPTAEASLTGQKIQSGRSDSSCYILPPDSCLVSGWVRRRQAGAELGQAQYKLRLDFTLIFCRFGLVELVCGFKFAGLIE